MALRTTIDQKVGNVDRFIPTAYDNVKIVADNIAKVIQVSDWITNGNIQLAIDAVALVDADRIAAEAAAAAAAADAAAVATTYDTFDDRFLGSFAVAPTLDNDGDPLLEGALYFDSVLDEMYVYTGTVWVQISGGGGGAWQLDGDNSYYWVNGGVGNIGIGINNGGFQPWAATYTALQLGGTGAFISPTAEIAGSQLHMLHNAYYDTGFGWKYIMTDEAARYSMVNGAHSFLTAVSGTADTAITWDTILTLDTNLNIGVDVIPKATLTSASTWLGMGPHGYIAADSQSAGAGAFGWLGMYQNLYFDVGYKYIANGAAGYIELYDGEFRYFSAVSGLADATPTFITGIKALKTGYIQSSLGVYDAVAPTLTIGSLTAGLSSDSSFNLVVHSPAQTIFRNSGATAFSISPDNHLAIGQVAHSSWLTNWDVLELGSYHSLHAESSNGIFLSNNLYWIGLGSPRIYFTGTSGYYAIQNGDHIWSVAPSGTTGASPSITEAMRIENNADLKIQSGVAKVNERAAAQSTESNYGQVWVRNDTPNILMFTDDAGNDFAVAGSSVSYGAFNAVAPDVYLNDSGISDIWFWPTKTDAIPSGVNLHAVGGLGTDIAGGDLGFVGGIGTGTGRGGYLVFSVAPASGASSATPNSTVEVARITDNKNILFNTTAEAPWGSSTNVIQFGDRVSLFERATSNILWLTNNAYFGTSWRRIASSYAAGMYMDTNGDIGFNVGTTGTADTIISWNEPLFIRNNGEVLVGADGFFRIKEKAAAATNSATYGELWIKNDAPNTLMYTDDAGNDYEVAGSTVVTGQWTPVTGGIVYTADQAVGVDTTTLINDFTTVASALMIGDSAVLTGKNTGTGGWVDIMQNTYYSVTGFVHRYVNSDVISKYTVGYGGHYWYVAPSGIAGNAATLTTAMQINTHSAGYAVVVNPLSYGTNPQLQIYNNSYGWYVEDLGGGNQQLVHAAGGRQRILSGGIPAATFLDQRIGVGQTIPNANWGNNFDVIDMDNGGLFSYVSVWLGQNVYHNNTNFLYKTTAAASYMQLSSAGDISFHAAPSGTVDTTASFIEPMRMYNTGVVRVQGNPTAAATKLWVYANDAHVDGTMKVEQDGTGDASVWFNITGVASWAAGIDNSDSQTFVITPNSDLANGQFRFRQNGGLAIDPTSIVNWGGNYPYLQLGETGGITCLSGTGLGNEMSIVNNAYRTNTAWKYTIASEEASRIYMANGVIYFQTAASGTEDADISWTTIATFDATTSGLWNTDGTSVYRATGNVGINDSSPGVRLVVKDNGLANPTVVRIVQDDATIANGLLITNDTYNTGYSGMGFSLNNSGEGQISVPATTVTALKFSPGGGQSFVVGNDGVCGVGFNTPETWHGSFAALEVGGNGAIFGHETEQVNAAISIAENFYFSAGSQSVYKTTDEASWYQQNSGNHKFYSAASGTAGTNITWTQALTIGLNSTQTNVMIGYNIFQSNTNTNFSFLQIGAQAALWSDDTEGAGRELNLCINVYDDGTEKYISTDEAAQLEMRNGVFTFNVTASGTLDTAITWSKAFEIDASANVAIGSAALGTTATDGFLYIPTCAGAPTGTPTAKTGRVALVFDTTNNNLYVYDGGWISVALA